MSDDTIGSKRSSVTSMLSSRICSQRPSVQSSYLGSEKKNSLDDLNDQLLINYVQDKRTALRHICLENKLLWHYLLINEPPEPGFENLMMIAIKKIIQRRLSPLIRYSVNTSIDVMRASSSSGPRTSRFESFSSLSSIVEGRGEKVNLSCKSDMVTKAIEEVQSNLASFLKKHQRLRRNIKSELKEYAIREKDIKESKENFDYNVMVQGVDPLTQRIPAEKFVRWMEEWLKSAQLNIEKLRLRTASLKIHHKKVSTIFVQRQELGENVRAVDFDQLRIENKHFAEKLEQKNVEIIEFKKMSGGANLILTNNKKELYKLQNEYNRLKALVTEMERSIKEAEQECEDIEEELEESKEKYDNFKRLTMCYKVPDVMEYVNIKSKLTALTNQMKVWHRRRKIQDITLNACLRQMKAITGSSKIHQSWLDDLNAEGAVDSVNDDEEEC